MGHLKVWPTSRGCEWATLLHGRLQVSGCVFVFLQSSLQHRHQENSTRVIPGAGEYCGNVSEDSQTS